MAANCHFNPFFFQDIPPVSFYFESVNQLENPRPPLPPFDEAAAHRKVRLAEDAWNTRNPEHIALAYTRESVWRNRAEFFTGRAAIVQFLTRTWTQEHDYRLIKELWAFRDDRIAVRFAYEHHDAAGQWWRSYGNELWEFDASGLMSRREASINDLRIDEADRRIFGPRPADEHLVDFPLQ